MKYGFIGAGNMVSAIIKGMTIGTKSFNGSDIYVSSKSKNSAQNISKECGCNFCDSNSITASNSDILVLGVKPHIIEKVIPEIKDIIEKKNPVVISIAAGKTINYLEELLPEKTPIIRVMPNINSKIGASTTGICINKYVDAETKEIAINMFKTIGSVIELDESQFSIFSVIGGASVAFAYLYMDALAHAGVKAGMTKKQALEITAETVLGSAKMILEGNESPWNLIDQVCSPGGTTIEGISSLQENCFESTIVKAFDAVLAKDALLGQKKN